MTFRAEGPSRRYARGDRLRADDVNKLSAAVRALNSPVSQTRVKPQAQARDLPARITAASAAQGDVGTITYDAVSVAPPMLSVSTATPANRPWPSGVEIRALSPGDPCVLRVDGARVRLLLMGAETILTNECPAPAAALGAALAPVRARSAAAPGRYARSFLLGAA